MVLPETMPVDEPIAATNVLLLLHVPPVVALVSREGIPWHTDGEPAMGDKGLTVTTVVALQPVGNE